MPTKKKLPLLLSALALAALLAVPTAAQATLAYVGNPLSHPTVFVAEDDGSNPRKIAFGSSPHVSPDGRLIAYLNEGRRFEQRLELAGLGGGRRRTLLVGWRESSELAFSPDGKKILALQGPGVAATVKLVLIDVKSGRRRVVDRGFFAGFGFSPDGSELVYARAFAARVFRPDIFRAATAGGHPVPITRDHRSSTPLWGARGIVFARNSGRSTHPPGTRSDLYLMNRKGGKVNRLTHTEAPGRHLAPVDWSEDGRRLLGQVRGRNGGYAVAVDPLTGAVRPIAGRSPGFVATDLSADGLSVLGYTHSVEGPEYVLAVPFEGGDPASLAADAVTPDWNG